MIYLINSRRRAEMLGYSQYSVAGKPSRQDVLVTKNVAKKSKRPQLQLKLQMFDLADPFLEMYFFQVQIGLWGDFCRRSSRPAVKGFLIMWFAAPFDHHLLFIQARIP